MTSFVRLFNLRKGISNTIYGMPGGQRRGSQTRLDSSDPAYAMSSMDAVLVSDLPVEIRGFGSLISSELFELRVLSHIH